MGIGGGAMKRRFVQIACVVLAGLAIQVATGCGGWKASSSEPTKTKTVSMKPDPALKALEAQVGMTFPAKTVLLDATDGGGRDASYEFYAWGLFSPAAMKMPPMKAAGVKDYLNLPLEDTVKSVQSMMGKRRISQAQSAFTSEWETNGYTFRGTLVRSAQGDHLLIERFRQK